jgi:hypothetical protein
MAPAHFRPRRRTTFSRIRSRRYPIDLRRRADRCAAKSAIRGASRTGAAMHDRRCGGDRDDRRDECEKSNHATAFHPAWNGSPSGVSTT